MVKKGNVDRQKLNLFGYNDFQLLALETICS